METGKSPPKLSTIPVFLKVVLHPNHLESLEKTQILQAYSSSETLDQQLPAASSIVYFPQNVLGRGKDNQYIQKQPLPLFPPHPNDSVQLSETPFWGKHCKISSGNAEYEMGNNNLITLYQPFTLCQVLPHLLSASCQLVIERSCLINMASFHLHNNPTRYMLFILI